MDGNYSSYFRVSSARCDERDGPEVSHLYGRRQARHRVFWGGASTSLLQVPDRLPAGRPADRHGNVTGGERFRLHHVPET